MHNGSNYIRRVVILLFLLAPACSTKFKINSGVDPTMIYAPRRTYAWMLRMEDSIPDMIPDRSGIDARIRSAIDNELAAKGYQQRTLGGPDVLVGYRLVIRVTHADTFQDLYTYYSAGGGADLQAIYATGYEEGTLGVEMIDAKTRQRIWWATAKPIVRSRDKGVDPLRVAVHAMFETLPPEPSSVPTVGTQ